MWNQLREEQWISRPNNLNHLMRLNDVLDVLKVEGTLLTYIIYVTYISITALFNMLVYMHTRVNMRYTGTGSRFPICTSQILPRSEV